MPQNETDTVGGASQTPGAPGAPGASGTPDAPETPGVQTAPEVERDAPAKSRASTSTRTAPPKVDRLPPYKVLLHNDDRNDMLDVVKAIVELTPLKKEMAVERMFEAHARGVSLLLTTHKERAELYKEQFHSKRLVVSIESGA